MRSWFAWTCKSILDTTDYYYSFSPKILGHSGALKHRPHNIHDSADVSLPVSYVISIGSLISMWTFSHTDPAFLEVRRNGRRSNFPSRHPVQRGAMDSSDWSNFGSPSTSLLIDQKQSIWKQGVQIADATGTVQYCTLHHHEISDFRTLGVPLQQLGRCNS